MATQFHPEKSQRVGLKILEKLRVALTPRLPIFTER
jgi:imidazoleglycerol phosphate synthase glutamine amidotransferase subunit HisH